MGAIIENAFTFFIIIFMGYMCKKLNLLTSDDGRKIGKIIIKITLPCAILSTVSEIKIGTTMLICIFFPIFVHILTLFMGYVVAKGKIPSKKAAYSLNSSGYNVGNFAIPFAQYFYDGTAISYMSMFDVGNSFMGLGINYCVASMISLKKNKQGIKGILIKLFSSIPFDVYIVIIALSIFNLQLPQTIINITSRIGNANTFLSMFMVGLLLEFNVNKEEIIDVVKIVLIRVIISIVLLLFVWFLLPVPVIAKQMIMISLLSPTMTVTPLFSYYVGYKGSMPAIISSVTMLISIVSISLLLAFFSM